MRDEVNSVLNVIAHEDFVLATGHLSLEEIFLLIPMAVTHGVRRIITTHPFYRVTNMSVDKQKELVDMHAQLAGGQGDGEDYQLYLEYAYTGRTIDGISFQEYRDGIQAIGPEHIILSSDAGQVKWPEWKDGQRTGGIVDAKPLYECWQEFVSALLDLGISLNDIKLMASVNPSRLLGIA